MVAMRDSSGAALVVGRFAGWEPLGFEAGDNNWYRFVANGPTEGTDPTGQSPHTQVTILRLLGSSDPNNFKLALELLAGIGAKSLADLGARGPRIIDAFLSRIYAMHPAAAQRCDVAAKLARDVFTKVGQSAHVITITSKCPGARFLKLPDGRIFSSVGWHQAVYANGRVYDAITLSRGMTLAEYVAKLESLNIKPTITGLPPGISP